MGKLVWSLQTRTCHTTWPEPSITEQKIWPDFNANLFVCAGRFMAVRFASSFRVEVRDCVRHFVICQDIPLSRAVPDLPFRWSVMDEDLYSLLTCYWRGIVLKLLFVQEGASKNFSWVGRGGLQVGFLMLWIIKNRLRLYKHPLSSHHARSCLAKFILWCRVSTVFWTHDSSWFSACPSWALHVFILPPRAESFPRKCLCCDASRPLYLANRSTYTLN